MEIIKVRLEKCREAFQDLKPGAELGISLLMENGEQHFISKIELDRLFENKRCLSEALNLYANEDFFTKSEVNPAH